MKEKIAAIFAPLASLNPLVYVFVVAMIPVIELRGAIPLGIALGLDFWTVFFISLLGSMFPAPFLILFFEKALLWFQEKGLFPRIFTWIDHHFRAKSEKIGNLQFWGIVIFTAIPLPGTGVWTASAIASLIKMPFKKALPAVLLGDLIAGSIVLALSWALIPR